MMSIWLSISEFLNGLHEVCQNMFDICYLRVEFFKTENIFPEITSLYNRPIHGNKKKKEADVIAQWIRGSAYHPADKGSNPLHNIYASIFQF